MLSAHNSSHHGAGARELVRIRTANVRKADQIYPSSGYDLTPSQASKAVKVCRRCIRVPGALRMQREVAGARQSFRRTVLPEMMLSMEKTNIEDGQLQWATMRVYGVGVLGTDITAVCLLDGLGGGLSPPRQNGAKKWMPQTSILKHHFKSQTAIHVLFTYRLFPSLFLPSESTIRIYKSG